MHVVAHDRMLARPSAGLVHQIVHTADSTRQDHVRSWHRPPTGGDLVWSRALGRDALVVGAIDVAGHGPALFPRATYARGVVDGALRDLASAPRMDVLGSYVAGALAGAQIEATWFLAVVRLSSDAAAEHPVLYEAVTDGYPAPILVMGPPFESLPSTAAGAGPTVLHAMVTKAPLRLVLASDGLLRRLGAGDEARGRRSLLSWQTGPQRDRDPRDHLGGASEPSDDESLLVMSVTAWDHELRFDVGDAVERARVKREVASRVAAALGADAEERSLRCIGEALSNVLHHAYGGGGPVVVRVAITPTGARLEIEDRGRGGSIEAGHGMTLIRHAATHVDVRNNHPSGTIVHVVL
jgi:hypothetical protein